MIISDKVYGKVKIDSPVIVELIKSKPMQRLKRISQFGVPNEFYHLKSFKRFEHCIGVMVLLKKLGASEEEQIAGLLHDISHTAFSHVVDFVIGEGGDEEFQDTQHGQYLKRSGIGDILKKFGYNLEHFSEHKNFPLLDQDSPGLCADRIDYSFREMESGTAKYIFQNLGTKNGKIIFKNRKSASLFANNYLKIQTNHWAGFEAVSRFRLFANALKIALDKRIIKFNDFWKTDDYIVRKIKSSKVPEIKMILSILRTKSLESAPKGSVIVYKKFRYVDPEFKVNGKLVNLTAADKNFALKVEKARKENLKGTRIPEISA